MPVRGFKKDKLVGLSDDDDDDSPSRQLFSEAQSPLVQQAKSSLARNADLLNAARAFNPVEPASSPPNYGSRSVQIQSAKFIGQKRSSDGRLKHPSILRADLVKIGTSDTIRRSVYEFPDSPEKTIASAQATGETEVQKRKRGRPRKQTIKPPSPVPPHHDPSAPVFPIPLSVPEVSDFKGKVADEATYKPSPPTGSPENVHRTRKSRRLAGEKADISAVNWEKRPESIIARSSGISPSGSKRKALSEAPNGTPNKFPRKETDSAERRRSLEGFIQQVQSYPVVAIPSSRAAHVQKAKLSSSDKVNADILSQAHLFGDPPHGADIMPGLIEESPGHGGDQTDADEPPVRSLPPPAPKTNQQSRRKVEIGRSQQLEILQKPTPATSSSRSGLSESHVEAAMVRVGSETGSVAIAKPNTRDNTNKGDPRNPWTADVVEVEEMVGARRGSNQVIVTDVENERDEDYHTAEEDGTPHEGITTTHKNRWTDLDIVFAFGHSEDREGSCQSKPARRIQARCSDLLDSLSDPDITMAEVEEACDKVRTALENVRKVLPAEVETQRAFEEDAFTHLFLRFARILEAVYGRYTEQFDDPMTSLSALRVIVPLMQDILSFKVIVSFWKVKVTHPSIDDRIVNDVEQKFIAPLRRVVREHIRALANLERAEAARNAQAARDRHEREKQARARKAAYAEDLRLRRERWRRLHIHRMKCEPHMDRQRLQHLTYISFENLEERDADGVPFEREEVFEHRPIPHAFKQLQARRRPWMDAEMEALLEGLKKYAGPSVFERIFVEYCKPGGPLRDFNVMEITAEAEHHRTCLIIQFDEHDWELPEWIKMIPVLP